MEDADGPVLRGVGRDSISCSCANEQVRAINVGTARDHVLINWEPPYLGSQKSLVPDVWLEFDSTTLIVDAKYKRHWEELQNPWSSVEEELREQHRNDLLQVLAYANLARTSKVIACLVYPCSPQNWDSLRARGRLIHRAELTVGSRSLLLWLTASANGDRR